jgi:hypothetical protein
LITLDGCGAGASYQDIAHFIHGAPWAEREWKSGIRSLKDRLHRAYDVGVDLRDGGYRALIS